MSREVKRVALDFEWPLRQRWSGYLMPEELRSSDCEECRGSGMNKETHQIHRDFYDHDGMGVRWGYDNGVAPDGSPAERGPWRIIGETRRWLDKLTPDEIQALVDEGRLSDLTHEWIDGKRTQKPDVGTPTLEQVNEWAARSLGHDGVNHWILTKVRAERLGVYGDCEHCHGEGYLYRDDEHRSAHDAWEASEPPAGEGWQMWETTSEGSPISPVMDTPEALARWLADNKASALGGDTASYEEWLDMINAGWAPSAAACDGRLISGVEFVSKQAA